MSLQTADRTVPPKGEKPASDDDGTAPRGDITGVTTRSRILVTGLLPFGAGE